MINQGDIIIKSNSVITEAISCIVIVVGRGHVCNCKRKKYREHNDSLAVTYLPVREERQHNDEQKQIPVIVEHISTRDFLSRYEVVCSNVQMRRN